MTEVPVSTLLEANKYQVPCREELWKQLSHAVTMCTVEDQVVWRIFPMFSAAHAALLVALFARGGLPTNLIGTIVSAAGTQLSFAAYIVLRRALGHLSKYEELVIRLEEALRLEPSVYRVSGKPKPEANRRYFGEIPSARTAMSRFTFGALLFWYTSLVVFVYGGASELVPRLLGR